VWPRNGEIYPLLGHASNVRKMVGGEEALVNWTPHPGGHSSVAQTLAIAVWRGVERCGEISLLTINK
jgi:hypothetical protein